MVRKTPDQDLGADELAFDHNPMLPPLSARRSFSPSATDGYTRPRLPSDAQNGPHLPSVSPTPRQANQAKKRAAPSSTTKGPAAKKAKAAPKPKIKLNAPKRVREDIYNSPERILGPKRSPLYTNHSLFPAILMDQETQQILASTELGFRFGGFSYGELARASTNFQMDGGEGRHDVEWLAAAWVAHGERAAGRFKEMEDEKFKEQWGGESGSEYEDSEVEEGVNESVEGGREKEEEVVAVGAAEEEKLEEVGKEEAKEEDKVEEEVREIVKTED